MCVRICRQWDVEDDEKLDQKAVRKAEIIVKVKLLQLLSNVDDAYAHHEGVHHL